MSEKTLKELYEVVESLGKRINKLLSLSKTSSSCNLAVSKKYSKREKELEEQLRLKKELLGKCKGYKRNKDLIINESITRICYSIGEEQESDPIITVCLLLIFNPEFKIFRGVSIQSKKDSYNKWDGIDIAEDRAIRAFRTGNNSLPVIRDEARDVVEELFDVDSNPDHVLMITEGILWKSCVVQELTKSEKEIISNNIENIIGEGNLDVNTLVYKTNRRK